MSGEITAMLAQALDTDSGNTMDSLSLENLRNLFAI
jgi:hypothetical protein